MGPRRQIAVNVRSPPPSNMLWGRSGSCAFFDEAKAVVFVADLAVYDEWEGDEAHEQHEQHEVGEVGTIVPAIGKGLTALSIRSHITK